MSSIGGLSVCFRVSLCMQGWDKGDSCLQLSVGGAISDDCSGPGQSCQGLCVYVIGETPCLLVKYLISLDTGLTAFAIIPKLGKTLFRFS